MFIDDINNKDIYTIDSLNKSKNNIIESKSFMHFFQQALSEINSTQENTKKSINKLEFNPSSTSLNDVMINLQKSSISIELAIQIRNKIISAYKEIMNQQV
ncbi:Flagellar hook-basal body complex protein FliE [Buchnera aphidicola (Protaphis terricola)]|uniref:flagellar hook-basal body complex protein FliE n=1 Tax=Buchnera aphidicola TaxID=9 RepID=UPI003464C1A9